MFFDGAGRGQTDVRNHGMRSEHIQLDDVLGPWNYRCLFEGTVREAETTRSDYTNCLLTDSSDYR